MQKSKGTIGASDIPLGWTPSKSPATISRAQRAIKHANDYEGLSVGKNGEDVRARSREAAKGYLSS